MITCRFMLLALTLLCCVSVPGAPAAGAVVRAGIDMLLEHPPDYFEGAKIGLITNASGRTADGQRTVEVMAERFDVRLIFAPEHGLEGVVPGGEFVPSGQDKSTGIPVFSLYGKTKRPTDQQLRELDLLVYDIQDAGVRAYTYISTMFNCMEEAADHNITFVVLDRPNPLGGNRVEGNVLEPEFKSFVGAAEIPYVYGLTPGELALWYNRHNDVGAKVKVVRMDNWQRSMTIAQTGLPWVPLSPNVPYPRTPFFLVVTGLVGELQMVSEGLGTDDPFAYIGAPWFDSEKFVTCLQTRNLPGYHFEPATFTPTVGTYKDEQCRGVHISLQPEQVNLFDGALEIMGCLAMMFPERAIFQKAKARRLEMFDLVCGTDRIRKSLVEKDTVVAELRDEFAQQRKSWMAGVIQHNAILYPEGNTAFLAESLYPER